MQECGGSFLSEPCSSTRPLTPHNSATLFLTPSCCTRVLQPRKTSIWLVVSKMGLLPGSNLGGAQEPTQHRHVQIPNKRVPSGSYLESSYGPAQWLPGLEKVRLDGSRRFPISKPATARTSRACSESRQGRHHHNREHRHHDELQRHCIQCHSDSPRADNHKPVSGQQSGAL